ncbi:alkaline phosphatase family protein [Type-D symbiont of Plautia stali]|uniref:alkaline phosphatase family protein n=1 Tax=Type-D symbiont of Plautia stali TaxID=1560356 RepID=UPI00128F9D7A|nr:alkaline phosphatase family protein [Type-D symbiont of Plautia stali]
MKGKVKLLTVIIGVLVNTNVSGNPNILLIGTDGTAARYIESGIDQSRASMALPSGSASPIPLPEYQSIVKDKHGSLTLDITSTTGSGGQRNTISGANWTSLLTGKEFDTHGVTDNTVVDVLNGEKNKRVRRI